MKARYSVFVGLLLSIVACTTETQPVEPGERHESVSGPTGKVAPTPQEIAAQIQREYKFFSEGDFQENLRGGGEKYFQSQVEPKALFYLLPNGDLYQYAGGAKVPEANAYRLATLSADYHRNPGLLFGSVPLTGFILSPQWITLAPGECSMAYEVTLRSGRTEMPAQISVPVSLSNESTWSYFLDADCLVPLSLPVFIPVGSVSLTFYVKNGSLGRSSLTVKVAEWATLSTQVEVSDLHPLARALRAQYELRKSTAYYENARRAKEKYILSKEGWFYLLPNGSLYQFAFEPVNPGKATIPGPNAKLIAVLSHAYYRDPSLLLND